MCGARGAKKPHSGGDLPDQRHHRGAHPQDSRDFAPEREPVLRSACEELSYLLTRGYAVSAASKLVGDRHQLTARQRLAVGRAACPDAALTGRRARRMQIHELAEQALALDGFNCLITVEAMLSGAPVFVGRDGALRDLASVHGSYRRVEETERAIELLIGQLVRSRLRGARIFLDRPVGNSGRVRALFEQRSRARGFAADVLLSDHVDRDLIALGLPVASSDSWLLDRARWLDLPATIADEACLALWRLTL